VYRVVIEYKEEAFAIECLQAARRLLEAAIDDAAFDVAAEVARLRKVLLDVQLGPSTRSIVNAALARGIPVRRLNDDSLVRLGQGAKQRRIIAAETDQTSAIAEAIAQDEELTRSLLADAGIPVPQGRAVARCGRCLGRSRGDRCAGGGEAAGGNQGPGRIGEPDDRGDVERAWQIAAEHGQQVVVERFVPGGDYRLLVVGNRMVAAARRRPPMVIGDGRSTVAAAGRSGKRRPAAHAATMSPRPQPDRDRRRGRWPCWRSRGSPPTACPRPSRPSSCGTAPT